MYRTLSIVVYYRESIISFSRALLLLPSNAAAPFSPIVLGFVLGAVVVVFGIDVVEDNGGATGCLGVSFIGAVFGCAIPVDVFVVLGF
jgi:hypothetical protein